MKIELIGFPMFYGCDRPGVEHGPDKLRENGIVDILKKHKNDVNDNGNIEVTQVDTDKKYASHKSMKYLTHRKDEKKGLLYFFGYFI